MPFITLLCTVKIDFINYIDVLPMYNKKTKYGKLKGFGIKYIKRQGVIGNADVRLLSYPNLGMIILSVPHLQNGVDL